MKREPVKSSVIASVGYDADAEMLEVKFHTGRTYRYFDVPRRVHRELLAAGSIGAYFNSEIRARYRSVEVNVAR